jgi:hypothetical protein
MTLSEIVEQLRSCGFECEAGPLESNVAFEELVRLASVEVKAPDWSQAPEWAQWWAVDPDGSAYWFEEEPVVTDECWDNVHFQYEMVDGLSVVDNWQETKVQRP